VTADPPVPPSGTVTFLFTDIEGSTQLWETDRAAMQDALARHDEILQGVFADHEGFVFSAGGDGFCVAFARADTAVEAAVAAQRGLGAESWPPGTAIRVRMGLHTGEAHERDGNYFGPALNHVGRLHAVAHGGQIVVSETTESVVRAVVEFVDLGVHELKDVGGSSPVFQVAADGLEREFPALRTVTSTVEVSSPNNLPLAVDGFVGRADDLVGVVAALADSKLVTLTGVGGTGKTRLAVEAAAELLPRFVDGVWLVELAPVSEAAAVPFVVGTAVGAVQQPGKSMSDSLLGSLATRELLLILDNCEHLLDEVAGLVSAIESRCPSVKVLATSREGLGLRGERLVPVGSLPAAEAADLFTARAHDAATEVVASDPIVGRIVERLDGLPLAIELAAARTRGLTVAEIEERLTERFRLLRGSSRGRVERHQTLWNTVAWSHQLLDETERLVFDRLSVFAGGFTLEAATNVCAADGVDEFDVEDAVLGLVERSMVVAEAGSDGTRYRLLETLRQFGETQLLDAGTIDQSRSHHARWYAEFAQQACAGSKGPDGIEWSRRLRAEVDNYRAVIYSDDLASARRILAALEHWPIWWEAFEFIDWAMAVLDPPAPSDPDWIGTALWAAALTTFLPGNENCGAIVANIDPDAIPPGLSSYLWLWHQVGDAILAGDDTVPFLQPMLDVATSLDDVWDRRFWTSYVAYLNLIASRLTTAEEIWETLDYDPATNTSPTLEAGVDFVYAMYLAAVSDPTAYDRFESCRALSADCGMTLLEHLVVTFQVPLLIGQGDFLTAQQRIVETVFEHIRTGSLLAPKLARVTAIGGGGYVVPGKEREADVIDRCDHRTIMPLARSGRRRHFDDRVVLDDVALPACDQMSLCRVDHPAALHRCRVRSCRISHNRRLLR
jgi:predicted ATPase/class 3 adenylate cyclase